MSLSVCVQMLDGAIVHVIQYTHRDTHTHTLSITCVAHVYDCIRVACVNTHTPTWAALCNISAVCVCLWQVMHTAVLTSLLSPSLAQPRPFCTYLFWLWRFFWPPSANLHSKGSDGAVETQRRAWTLSVTLTAHSEPSVCDSRHASSVTHFVMEQ